jgi:hypothetical protein
MKAVEWLQEKYKQQGVIFNLQFDQAKEMEKEQKIELLKSLVYSVCIGDDVEDVEEWLKEHELNKSK